MNLTGLWLLLAIVESALAKGQIIAAATRMEIAKMMALVLEGIFISIALFSALMIG
jgi:hypothetical protein